MSTFYTTIAKADQIRADGLAFSESTLREMAKIHPDALYCEETRELKLKWDLPDLDLPDLYPRAVDKDRSEAYRLLTQWVTLHSDEGCRRDHHGNCQAHYGERDCIVERTQLFLNRVLFTTAS